MHARLLFLTALIALATGCWDFTTVELRVLWDPDAGRITVTETLTDLRANDDGACRDDAARCADFLQAELAEGNVLELSDEAKILEEHLQIRENHLDLVVRFEIPDQGAAAREMGFMREDQGRVGKERAALVYTNDRTLPLFPVDPPRRLLHRRVHGDPPDEAWVIDRKLGELVLASTPPTEPPETPGVLEAMPELAGLLRERGLVSP